MPMCTRSFLHKYQDATNTLQSSSASLRCQDIKNILTDISDTWIHLSIVM